MRAATYRRVSTDEQTYGHSLGAQRDLCAAEVAKRGWTLAGEYEDAGLSGASDKRPAWNGMLEAARRGELDVIVVHAISRFSRSKVHTEVTLDELSRLGVGFLSLTENFDLTTPVGRMTQSMMTAFAQLEREQTAQRVAASLRSMAGRGVWPGGDLPFGLRLREGAVEVHPDEAALVARMAWMILDGGMTTGDVAKALAAEGTRGRNGGRIAHQWVRRTLVSERLIGKVTYGKPGSSRESRSTKVDGRGVPIHGEPVVFEVPLVLDPETFERLQRVLSARAQGRRAGSRVYPLTGVLTCPHGHSIGSGSWRDVRAYKCSDARWQADRVGERCQTKPLRADETERRVWDALWPVLGKPSLLQKAVKAALADAGTTANRAEDDLRSTREALARTRKGLSESLAAAIRGGAGPDVVEATTRAITGEITTLEKRAERLERVVGAAGRGGDDHLQALCRAAAKLTGRSPDLGAMRDMLALLGVRVRLTGYGADSPIEVTAAVSASALAAAVSTGEPVGSHR